MDIVILFVDGDHHGDGYVTLIAVNANKDLLSTFIAMDI